MGYSWFLKLALNCIDHLAWPLLALGYPLCASAHAIEADSYSETRDLMSYWILLSLIYLFEYAFLRLLSWFQFWHYIKLMMIFWLIIPNFGRASYVYNNLIRSCITVNPQAVRSRLKSWRKVFVKKENFLLHAERYIQENGIEALEKLIANKLNDKYQEFVTSSDRDDFTAKLQEVEDWLYEEGEDETKGVYIAKPEELQKQGEPIEARYKEFMERGTVIDQFNYCINSYREAAMSNDPKFDHIDISDKQKVLNECVEAENWLREKQQQQESLPKYANPVLLSAEIIRKAEAVDRVCKPIMTKPRPAKPATPPAPELQKAPKKKVKKTNIPVAELVFGSLAPVDVQKAVEKEFEMALQDRVMEETKDRKNAVEAYVYDMRNKLNDKYQEFVTSSDRDDFTAKLQEVEDWLYGEGEDETKGVYIAKLEELQKQGDPIEARYKEFMERGTVIDQFNYCINSYREAAVSNDPKFDHIDISDKKVLNECVEAENWLREKQQQQESLPKYANPVLLSAEIIRKAEAVDRVCKPIMTKPRPAKPATHPTSSGW